MTERLELRLPVEADRSRFVELFCDDDFMIYSGGVADTSAANARFDQMLSNAAEVLYAKQPIIERSTGTILGYSGVAFFDFEGSREQEFGYRLCPQARGKGYATEAGLVLVEVARAELARAAAARSSAPRTIYAMIDPRNEPSVRVAAKLGFVFWKQEVVNGYLDNLYRLAPDNL